MICTYSVHIQSANIGSMYVVFYCGGQGQDINKIKEKKEKHTWPVQVMDEMLKYVEPFEYDSGSIPQLSQPRSGETVPYDQIDPTSHWMVPGKRYKKVFDQETSLLAYYGEANPDDSESEEEPRPKASAHHSSEVKQKEEGNFLTLPTMKVQIIT